MTLDPTEAQTRRGIDKQLARVGWIDVGADFEEEFEVGSVGDADYGFTDYALKGADGRVLAVVEAKRTSRDALAGKEQATLYADAIEARHGYRPFIFLTNGLEIWFWDNQSNPRRVGGFFRREDLERRRFQLLHRKGLTATQINSATAGRIYQQEAIRRVHERFESGHRKSLWVMATGTGKTRSATALIETLMDALWAERVLFLVDRNPLGTQALDAFREFLPNEPAERIRTATYDDSKRLYVATLQTMQDFYLSFSAGAFDLVISDECHRSIYNKWEAVLTYFDALLLGLTATPSDFIDRNTFQFFDCSNQQPTHAYQLDQAIADGFLVPYEVYHARTTIQIDGIRGLELPPEVQEELQQSGIDPEDIDFAGTELERRVTNTETTRLLVTEFFENALRPPNDNLPGKSIIFAMSHAHARRLYESFLNEYPQFPGLVEIIDSHMENPEAILGRFKRESLPRIAISVDMLDAGIDIPTVLNLGFMKPVFSKIKFWQMIGRGTRRVDDASAKPWCPAYSKSVFRILDFWENFRRFQLNPAGVEPSASQPVVVRLFRAWIRAARAADGTGRHDLAEEFTAEARSLINQLPLDSAGVRENLRLIEDVTNDLFWMSLDEWKYQLLTLEVAPLMRYIAGISIEQASFQVGVLDCLSGVLTGDHTRASNLAHELQDGLRHLPEDHPDVRAVRQTLHELQRTDWPDKPTLEALLELLVDFSSLMHLRQPEPQRIITLNIADAFREQQFIAVGPEGSEFDAARYRQLVEDHVRELAESHPAMLKLRSGEPLSDGDLAAIEEAISGPDLYVTEETLRAAYRAPHGSLVSLLRHALGVEELASWPAAVQEAFETFISEKGYLNADQLTFVRLFARRLIETGRVERFDLFEEPFLRLGSTIDRAFDSADLDAMMALASRFEVV